MFSCYICVSQFIFRSYQLVVLAPAQTLEVKKCQQGIKEMRLLTMEHWTQSIWWSLWTLRNQELVNAELVESNLYVLLTEIKIPSNSSARGNSCPFLSSEKPTGQTISFIYFALWIAFIFFQTAPFSREINSNFPTFIVTHSACDKEGETT